MKASIKNGTLILEIPVNAAPKPSSTGKSLMVASTAGSIATDVKVNGETLVVSVNAYVKAK